MSKLVYFFIAVLFIIINACVKDNSEEPKTVYQDEAATLLNTGINQCEHIIVLKMSSENNCYFPTNLPDSLRVSDYEDVIVSFEIIEGKMSCDYVDHPNYDFSTSLVEFENIMITNIEIE